MGVSASDGGMAMWKITGEAKGIEKDIIARYSRKSDFMDKFFREHIYSKKISDGGVKLFYHHYFWDSICDNPVIEGLYLKDIEELHEGDILRLTPNGEVQRLFDVTSRSNVLFVTENCNSRCIMCPQPQRAIDHTREVLELLKYIPKQKLSNICISGGEPTVCRELVEILSVLRRFPNVKPIMLTNGRKFHDFQFARSIVQSAPENMIYAIPLYSAIPQVHDYIVGAPGAFKESVQGIYNLTRFRAPIEIRVVMTKQNFSQLYEIANFIGWNLPMVVHVAFMGMETVGRAAENGAKVWIDPGQYMDQLKEALMILKYRNITASIYNLPLCILPRELRRYACNSISEWKQGYIPQCTNCERRGECCGIFTTSKIIPKNIVPFASGR